RDPGRGQEGFMTTKSLARSVGEWNIMNLSAELLRMSGVPTKRIRYESFIENPQKTLEELASFAGLMGKDFGINSKMKANLGMNHSMGGNPTRFKRGMALLRAD